MIVQFCFILLLIVQLMDCQTPFQPCSLDPVTYTDINNGLKDGAVSPPDTKQQLDDHYTRAYEKGDQDKSGGVGSKEIYKLVEEIVETGHKNMQAMLINSQARDSGDNFVPLLDVTLRQPAPTFPTTFKDIMQTGAEATIASTLAFYGESASGDLRQMQMQFLSYIGAPVTLLRDITMHATFHNANCRDTLADFKPVPHFFSGLMPDQFPKNFEEFMDDTIWPADKIKTVIKDFYQQEPVGDEIADLRIQLLEYIGAPVTILRDTIMHTREYNYQARDLKSDFKPVPHAILGILPKVPFPKDWNAVMNGDFTVDNIKDLLTFYYQDIAEKATTTDLQIQILDYIGAPVNEGGSSIERRASLIDGNTDGVINPIIMDSSQFPDNLMRTTYIFPVPF